MVVPSPVRSTAEELSFNGEPLAAQDEQIVVTGSRIRGGQTTSPSTTISRRDAERAGQTDLGQVIRDQIGRAHVRTPVTNAHIVCSPLLATQKLIAKHDVSASIKT